MTDTSTIDFTITFHGPFRVSTGHAKGGLDAAVDMTNPLPNTSLKGLMRATTAQLIGEQAAIIGKVFGSPARECPWRWSRAKPDGDWDKPQAAARVSIDSETHSAMPDMLGISEQTGATSATFTVTQRGALTPADLATHRVVLAIAGQATRSLGANRRRGLGWVTITSNVELDRDSVEKFLNLGKA